MGLDMCLYEVTYEDNKIILSEVAYFRKANMVHGWFVDNIQDGNDTSAYYRVEGSSIARLRDLIRKALKDKDATLLPPKTGFFFGNYEINDRYWEMLKESLEKLEALDEDKSYMYSSSW